jgi:hypothetical protein
MYLLGKPGWYQLASDLYPLVLYLSSINWFFIFKFVWNFVSRQMGGAALLELGASVLFTQCRCLSKYHL